MKEKEYNIEDIYIGFEKREDYNDFLEEFELWEDHILLEKTNYNISVGEQDIVVYKDIKNDNNIYVNNEGFVMNSVDELTGEERYHKIDNIINIKELVKLFQESNREESQYRRYVLPIYEKVFNLLKDRKSISNKELNKFFGNISDVYSYIFGIITEDEYEELFGCKTYDFETGARVRK